MEIGTDIHAGDGAAGSPLSPGAPADVGAAIIALLEEQRTTNALLRSNGDMLRRIWLGDAAQLDRSDVAAVLGVSMTKVDEMIADGLIPTYRLPSRSGKGRQRVGWDTLRTVIRRWAA